MKRGTIDRIDACLEGTLHEDGFAELQRELRDDPATFQHYCHQAEIHGRLEWELGEPAQSLVRGIAETPAPVRSKIFPFLTAGAAAAALILLGFGIARHHTGNPAADASGVAIEGPTEIEFVARITRGIHAEWLTGPLSAGAWLQPGPLNLIGGTAEISFDCGATVWMEAPAVLHLNSPSHARLESGKATVEVPDGIHGFVFETPGTLLSERGSRFGVAVESDGSTEIHVLQGKVEINGKWGDLESLMLGENRPVRVDAQGVMLAGGRYRADEFPAREPISRELLPEWFLHWSFDSAATSRATFRDSGEGPHRFPAEVRLSGSKGSVSLIPGHFGNGIRLNGERAFLATQFPGIAGASPRTLAFWVRIPANTPETFAYSILSWGSEDFGRKWQIGWNTGQDNRGTRGAIRTEVQGGYQVGSTSLLDGQWHHVAVVLAGGPYASTGSHLRHYVNGRLEASTATQIRTINTGIDGENAVPFSIGRRLDDDRQQTFKGDLDEMYLFPIALTPEQILDLYLENRPPTTR